MAQRVLKIVLPQEQKELALGLLEQEQELNYWQEESSFGSFVVSVLAGAERSEAIMDAFAHCFAGVDGFRLIVYPVAASLPRPEEPEEEEAEEDEKKLPLRVSREELYVNIVDGARLSRTFLVMTVLATVVAVIGLLNDNVAVIIGAMVIAPFLGPNVALAFSTCLADEELGRDSLKTLFGGILLVVILAMGLGAFWQVLHPETSPLAIGEVTSRIQPDLSDILLAFAAGCAGVWAFTTGASSTILGVMVAVALLPPLAVFGLLLGTGNWHAAIGAFLLFATNIIGINLAGVLTFRAQGVTPRNWWEEGKAKAARKKATLLWSASLVLLVLVILFWAA